MHLPYGLKCSPEIFQCIMDQMLEGIELATAVMDDILVTGCDIRHHDYVLSYNVQLNYRKCQEVCEDVIAEKNVLSLAAQWSLCELVTVLVLQRSLIFQINCSNLHKSTKIGTHVE